MGKMRLSDHCYDWSDFRSGNRFVACLAAASEAAFGATTSIGCGVARFAPRALQALRQTGLQVCRGAWPWAEVLPLGQPAGNDPAFGLHSLRIPSSSAGVCDELSPGARCPQADLCHQPRAVAPTTAAVNPIDERDRRNSAGRFCPGANARGAGRQHAPELFPPTTASRGA